MEYQKLGNTELRVSKIAFGCWGLGGGSVWSDSSLSVRNVEDLLDEAKDLGINYIDTAPVYGIGQSETLLSKALKGRRDHFIVQTKCSLNWRNEGGEFEYERDGVTVNRDHRASAIRKDVEESLQRLDIEHIDAIVVHRISRTVPVQETMEELMKLKQEGKIRAVLISNSEPSDLEEYEKYGYAAGVQEKFSLLDQTKRNYFDTCDKYNAIFQVYGSLEEGFLCGPSMLEKQYGEKDIRTGKKWAKEPHRAELLNLYERLNPVREAHGCSWANLIQAWTLAQYQGISLLTGFRRTETMRDTCRVFDLKLSEQEIDLIGKSVKML